MTAPLSFGTNRFGFPDSTRLAETCREAEAAAFERSPLKRMITADNIVDATVLICSHFTRSVSGQVLAVNAGEPAG